MKPFRLLSVYFFLLFIFLLTACQTDPEATSTLTAPNVPASPFPASSATKVPTLRAGETRTLAPTAVPSPLPSPTIKHRGGAITVAGVGSPTTEITALPDFVSNALFDSLLRVNPQDGSLEPGLASSWLVSEDAKTVAFVLRDDVKWHDGKPLTTDDVAFTLKALSDPEIRITPAANFGALADVTATGARTVTVTFTQADCAALTSLAMVKILPKHILENENLANVPPEKLIGTGPLTLQTWQEGVLTFTANKAYWGGEPWITDWTYRTFPDARAAHDAVRQGLADVVLAQTPVADLQNTPFALNAFYALAFNTTRTPFDDVRVRQALAFAVDRGALASEVNGTVLETSLLPAFWALPQNMAQPKFDATRARQLLSDAGWRDTDGDGILDKDGEPLSLTLWAQSDDSLAEETAQRVRAQLEKIGVQAVLKLADRTLFLTRVFLQEYDMAIAHFHLPLDPDQRAFWTTAEDKPGYGLNVTGYTNPSVEAALDAGNAAAKCAPDARKKAYAPVWQQLASDVPMVFLFAPPQVLNLQARVQETAPNLFGGAFENLNQWSVTP